MTQALLVLLAAVLLAGDPSKIRPRDAASYPARETHEGVTIAAEPYATAEAIKTAFEKHDPRKFGVLPVYVVIFNPTKDAVRLDNLTIELTGRNRERYPRIAADDVSRRINGFKMPQGIKPAKVKAPISAIIDQEFVVKMVPPGDTIGGFLYFDRFPQTEAGTVQLYLNGLRWAGSGKELLFYEINFEVIPDPGTRSR